MKIKDFQLGYKIKFVPCGTCLKKKECLFCRKGVKPIGEVVGIYLDSNIPVIEVKVKGADELYEMTQFEIDHPDIVSEIISEI